LAGENEPFSRWGSSGSKNFYYCKLIIALPPKKIRVVVMLTILVFEIKEGKNAQKINKLLTKFIIT
jgi:hypothetical protein